MSKIRFIIPTRGDHAGLKMTCDSIRESCDDYEIVLVTENRYINRNSVSISINNYGLYDYTLSSYIR